MKQALTSITSAIEAAQSILTVKEEVFTQFKEMITKKPGHLWVSGVGKSGIVARKFADTMASIGFQVSFMAPEDFSHGGAGRIAVTDTVLFISKSGNTAELEQAFIVCDKLGVEVYGLSMVECGSSATLFDLFCDTHIRLPTVVEGDKFNLVPTSSVIAMLVFLDAVSMELMNIVMDKPEQFKAIHLGGTIGQR